MSLFQTNAWQSAWWETWGQQKGFRLIRPWDGEVSGLYESRYLLKGMLPVRSLQFVGTSYRELRTPRTEHNRFASPDLHGQPLLRKMESLLLESDWTEAVFNDLKTGSEELSALVTLAATHNWAFRITASDDGYAVSTSGDFDTFLGNLGTNTRLRLFNRRKVLEDIGTITQENAWPGNPEDFLEHLNRFHRARWKKNCVTPTSWDFHRRFLERIGEEGGKPQLMLLKCDKEVISVLYNVEYKGVVYNIQAGFDENFHKKVSLGSLHLGYAIEQAFRAPDVRQFDLLAGKGKKEDYKSRFANHHYQFISVMLVKSMVFRALYWMRG